MLVRLMMTTGLLLAPISGIAQNSGPGWTADLKTGCRVVNAHPQPHETITWSGGCVNGYADGQGVLQWFLNGRPEEHYEGTLRGGEMNGQGILISGNGGRYEGGFLNGKAAGFGTWKTPSGSFSGTWINGCYNNGGKRAWVGADATSCP